MRLTSRYLLFLYFFTLVVFGQVTPHARMTLEGVPLNTLYIVFSIAIIPYINQLKSIKVTVIFSTLLLLMGWSVFYSLDIEYGFYKIFNLWFLSFFVFIYFSSFYFHYGEQEFIKSLAITLSIYLILAIVYKSIFGFFNRDVPFFINGPIVFARLMGLGFICCIFLDIEKRKKLLLLSIFFMAIIWPSSKGPLISVLLVSMLSVIRLDFKSIIKLIVAILFFYVFFAYMHSNISYLIDYPGIYRLFVGLFQLFGDTSFDTYNSNSVGSRWDNINISLNIFKEYPVFGAGLGSWGKLNSVNDLYYPHNIIMELLSETGIFGLTIFIALMSVLVLIPLRKKFIFMSSSFFFINQLFSGDLLDAKFLFLFIFLAWCVYLKDSEFKVGRKL